MDHSKAAEMDFADIAEGMQTSFDVLVTEEMIDMFARLSGDYSPLHVDKTFAAARGFESRVAHGGLSMLFFSRMVGMLLPGANALLQSVKLSFVAPVYAGDEIRYTATVTQVSESTRTIVLKGLANKKDGSSCCKATIQVGFTSAGHATDA